MVTFVADPRFHRCDVGDLDYSEVILGRIVCTACDRVWYLTPSGWVPDPMTRTAPR